MSLISELKRNNILKVLFGKIVTVKSTAGQGASDDRLRLLFNSMSEGFCLIEMLYDEQGRANDYRYIEVNPAFKKQSGLQNVVGKRIREFAPNLEEFWFEKFGKVALTGEPVEIENEAKDLNRWFNVKAFKVGAQDNQKADSGESLY